jgi:hypothetical protein
MCSCISSLCLSILPILPDRKPPRTGATTSSSSETLACETNSRLIRSSSKELSGSLQLFPPSFHNEHSLFQQKKLKTKFQQEIGKKSCGKKPQALYFVLYGRLGSKDKGGAESAWVGAKSAREHGVRGRNSRGILMYFDHGVALQRVTMGNQNFHIATTCMGPTKYHLAHGV